MTSTEIEEYRKALQQLYRNTFSHTTFPCYPKSRKQIDLIYVRLVLLTDSSDYEPVSLEQIFEVLRSNTGRRRMALLGEAGVGKTTLLSKIAYDWAVGSHLKEIELLFFVPLRQANTNISLSNIPKEYGPESTEKNYRKVTKYIRANPEKVMLLLDGLDEYKQNIKEGNDTDALVGIVRGDVLQYSPVIISTRPWRAEQITSVEYINMRYTRILVAGFQEDDVKNYISKFFDGNPSAASLIQRMTEDSLVAETVAPYPIFCSMLCHIWANEQRQKSIQRFQTFSQLFYEMIDSLKEQWYSKATIKFKNNLQTAEYSFKTLGKVALNGCLTKQFIFAKTEFEEFPYYVGCDIGVLSSNKRFIVKQADMISECANVSFSHKLFQEYLAALYLASIYKEDPAQFANILKSNILPHYKEFRYLLYFTASSHWKDIGDAGTRALLKLLCEEIDDNAFIMDVAFECHHVGDADAALKYLEKQTSLSINIDSKHTLSGYMYILAAHASNVVKILSTIYSLNFKGLFDMFDRRNLQNNMKAETTLKKVTLLIINNLLPQRFENSPMALLYQQINHRHNRKFIRKYNSSYMYHGIILTTCSP